MIIAFEGLDKAGKGTQSKLLHDALRRQHVSSRIIDFPTHGTTTGDAVSAYLEDRRQHAPAPHAPAHVVPCLAAADMWAAAPRVETALDECDVLILNRSPASNIAYGSAAGLSPSWLRMLTDGHPANQSPRLTILLDIPVSESFSRQPDDRDAFESNSKFLERAAAAYVSEARRHDWLYVWAARPADEVHNTILHKSMPRILEAMWRREEGV